jgi:phosphoribosyl-ATP pyrophosphohydrolase
MIEYQGLNQGWLTITNRAESMEAGKVPKTYVEKLIADPNERVKKFGSETFELVRELTKARFNQEDLIGEVADVVFCVEVMSAAHGLDFRSIFEIIDAFEKIGCPSDDQRERLLNDQEMLIKSLGSTAANLAAGDSSAIFNKGRFLGLAASLVSMTAICLEGYGVTFDPVIDELAARNAANPRRLV